MIPSGHCSKVLLVGLHLIAFRHVHQTKARQPGFYEAWPEKISETS